MTRADQCRLELKELKSRIAFLKKEESYLQELVVNYEVELMCIDELEDV
jgi:hypothetical protein